MKIQSENLKIEGKVAQLIHDLVVYEDVCNFNCNYCMTPSSPFQKEDTYDDKEFVWDLSKLPEMVYDDDHKFKENVDKVLDNYHECFDAPILKISGGEVMLVKNVEHLLKKESERYETVQILTNGSLFTEDLFKSFRNIPNLSIIVSIDGHTHEMNQYRVRSQSIHRKLISNLDRVVNEGIYVEIYCVLNNKNTPVIDEFADFLLDKYNGDVGLTPFPVRHHAAPKYGPQPDQLEGIKRLIDNFEHYKKIVPSLAYLTDLYDFISTSAKRKIRCLTPFLMFQSFHNGTVTPCPYAWFDKVGNISQNPEEVVSNYGNTRTYDFLTTDPPRAPFCKSCFTDTHALALYYNGVIELDDLICSRPILQRPKARQRLLELKELFTHHYA